MDQIILIIVVTVPCLALPINALLALSIIGVMLADTKLIPQGYIYFARFVPVGIFCFRSLVLAVVSKTYSQTSSYMIRTWAPFLSLALLSTAYSLEPSITFQRFLSAFFVLVGFGTGIPLYLSRSDKKATILKIISVIMGLTILYSLHLGPAVRGPANYQGGTERFHGIFSNPNTLGLMAMQVIFLLIYWWQRETNRITKRVLLATVILVLVTMLASGSRASTLGFLLGIGIFVFGNKKTKTSTLKGVSAAGLIIISSYLVGSVVFPEYVNSVFRSEYESRTFLWERAWKLAMGSPLFGVGFCGSDPLFNQDALYLKAIGIPYGGSHSSLMRLLVDMGFVGVFLSAAPFVLIIRKSWKHLLYSEDPQLAIALLSVIGASLTNALYEGWLFGFGSASTVPFWFFLALLSHQAEGAAIRAKWIGKSFSWKMRPVHELHSIKVTSVITRSKELREIGEKPMVI